MGSAGLEVRARARPSGGEGCWVHLHMDGALNRRRVTPDGGAVSVRARIRGSRVSIAINDNGIGIARQALHKLGRPFEQVESQLTKRHQGSGLGLAIAKSLVELHGGTMRIRSRLGRGTMVVVRLPAGTGVATRMENIDAAA